MIPPVSRRSNVLRKRAVFVLQRSIELFSCPWIIKNGSLSVGILKLARRVKQPWFEKPQRKLALGSGISFTWDVRRLTILRIPAE